MATIWKRKEAEFAAIKEVNRQARFATHHVVHVFPVVQGDELERGEHGPEEVVEAGVAEVGVFPHVGKTNVSVGATPVEREMTTRV